MPANVDGKRSGKTHEPSTKGGLVRRYVYHVLAAAFVLI
jgi:hypothetical protein